VFTHNKPEKEGIKQMDTDRIAKRVVGRLEAAAPVNQQAARKALEAMGIVVTDYAVIIPTEYADQGDTVSSVLTAAGCQQFKGYIGFSPEEWD
jgi:hypothetical protein